MAWLISIGRRKGVIAGLGLRGSTVASKAISARATQPEADLTGKEAKRYSLPYRMEFFRTN